jgi:hypothetical protein
MPFDALPGPYAQQMAAHGYIPANHAAPNFERVEVRELFDDRGVKLEGWRRIYNVDRGTTLHVATDKYQLIDNDTCYGLFETALRDSDLDLTGMHIATDMSHGGGRTFRQYLLPAHNVPVKAGVDVALRIIMLNSYDGSMAFRGLAGAFNFVCANTSIFGNKAADFTVKHLGRQDMQGLIGNLVSAAEGFTLEAEGMRRWPEIEVSDTKAMALLRHVPAISEAVYEHLTTQWLRAAINEGEPNGGRNFWTLYNVLTAWATHGDARGANAAATRFSRDGVVRRTLDAKPWKEAVLVD